MAYDIDARLALEGRAGMRDDRAIQHGVEA
jgi:hypothetical protein